MDPFSNPFAPGAGSRPPELAGREEYINHALTRPSGDPDPLNHSRNPKFLAIQFSEYTAQCKKFFLEVPSEQELRALFPNSRTCKFLEKKAVLSRIQNRTIRCYVFLKEQSE